MNEIEITIKILNTPNHDFLPMGKSFNFIINPNDIFQNLYDLINEKIKEYIIIPPFLTFSLLTNEKNKINLNDIINSSFTTDHHLDIIDRNENIFYLYFHNFTFDNKFDILFDNNLNNSNINIKKQNEYI